MSWLNAGLETLKSAIEDSNEDSIEIQKLRLENEELKELLNKIKQKAGEKIKKLLKELQEKEEERLEMEATIELQHQKLANSIENEELNEKYRLSQSLIEEKNVEIVELQQKIGNLSLLEKKESQNFDSESLHQKLEAALAEINSLRKQAVDGQTLQQELDAAVAEIDTLRTQANQGQSMEKELKAALLEVESLRKKVEDGQTLQQELDAALAEIESLNINAGQGQSMEKELAAALLEVESLRKKLKDGQNLQQELDAAVAEIDTLRIQADQGQSMEKELAAALLEVESLRKKVEDGQTLQQELDAAVAEINSLNIIAQESRALVNELECRLNTKESIDLNDTTKSSELESELLELKKAHEDSLALVNKLDIENCQLISENESLQQKIAQIKEAVSERISSEIEQGEILKQQIINLEQEKTALISEIVELKESLVVSDDATNAENEDKQREYEYLLSKTTNLVENLKKSETETERLREHLVQAEEDFTKEILELTSLLDEYKMRITNLESELGQQAGLEASQAMESKAFLDELEELKAELIEYQTANMELNRENRVFEERVASLEGVLEQLEISRAQEMEDALYNLQTKLNELQTQVVSWQNRAQTAEHKLLDLEQNISNQSELESQLSEKTNLVGKLRRDLLQLQTHLSEAMKRLKESAGENSVDKKLIGNLLIGFMEAKYGDAKRFEILNLISIVLGFNDDEKSKVGLLKSPTIRTSITQKNERVGDGETFMDMWITFLDNETKIKNENNETTSSQNEKVPTPTDSKNGRGLFGLW